MRTILCKRKGCRTIARARGYCSKHYAMLFRQRRLRRLRFRMGEKKCRVPGCGNISYCRKMCTLHYSRWMTHHTFELAPPRSPRFCKVKGCGRPHSCRGFCEKHYSRWRSNGSPHILRRNSPGTGWINSYGYRIFEVSGKQISEHRRVMESKLGRKLRRNEVVHHVNGKRLDNREENLVVLSKGAHSRLHNLGRKYWGKNQRLAHRNG